MSKEKLVYLILKKNLFNFVVFLFVLLVCWFIDIKNMLTHFSP